MSLTSALNIGRSALNAGQLGIQVTGNNIANAATPGYSRQIARLVPIAGEIAAPQGSIGRGVGVRDIRRQVDEALLARLWATGGTGAAAAQQQQILEQLEATIGELGDNSLSSELTEFFSTWSERANQTNANAVVVQQGDKIAAFVRRLRTDLINQRSQLDGQLGAAVGQANGILQSIAQLNRQISAAEVGGSVANALRDQRDQAITELSELMDVTVIDHGVRGVDILVGSTPILLDGNARELEAKRESVNGELKVSVALKSDGQSLAITGGQLGGILQGRTDAVDNAIATLDSVASQLIFQVNRLHSTGRNLEGLTRTSATQSLSLGNQALALNDPNNTQMSALPFEAKNGSFLVSVRDRSTGGTRQVRIGVDLDGVNAAGTPGFADDTSAEDIRAAIDAIEGVAARFTPEGQLEVTADSGFEFSFEEDTSDALAALGVNSFFTGTNADSIGVREDLLADPSRMTSGRMIDGQFVENGTALEIARLSETGLEALGGSSITGSWRSAAEAIGG